MWMDFLRVDTKSVSNVNVHERLSASEETNQVEKMTCSVNVSQAFSQDPHSVGVWAKCPLSKDGGYSYGLDQSFFFHSWPVCHYWWVLKSQMAEISSMTPCLRRTAVTCGSLIILDLFHQGGDSGCLHREHIQILDMNLLPLPTELLLASLSMNSQCA